MGLSLAKQLLSPQKMFVINKVQYFYLLVCLYAFNPLPLLLKWVMTLVATTYRNMARGKFCKITNKIRVKGSDRTPFIFIFRLNIVLHNSYQADEIGIESEKWKQKVHTTMSKALVEFY